MYYYTMFYHTICSDIEIKEAIPIDKPSEFDIRIEVGDMPDYIMKEIEEGHFDGISADRSWFYVKNLLICLVTNGEHILIKTIDNEATELCVVSFITGLAMALCLTQRGYVPMHGGALCVKDSSGYIITGNSGSGKSSTMTQLRQKGAIFMADDLAVIDVKSLDLLPGFPVQKLCGNMVNELELDRESLTYIGEYRDKYEHHLKPDQYKYEKKKLKAIFEIVLSEGDELLCREIEGSDKLKIIANNIFCIFLVQNMPMDPMSMMNYLKIAQGVRVFRIERPKDKNTLSDISDWIYERMLQNC